MCFKRRKTIMVSVCGTSGLLPNEWCIEAVKRKYYKEPRPGEPDWTKLTVCTVHAAPVPPDPVTVTVVVCKACGLLPGPNTKATEGRTFLVGEEPTAPCKCAAPPPPIPQADHSEPRTGMDFYQMIAFSKEEILTYLDNLVLNGGSLLRLFFVYIWPEDQPTAGWRYCPYKQVGKYVEHGGAFDGQLFPLFTIAYSTEYGSPWNDPIWLKYRNDILAPCAERGIRVTMNGFDGCSMTSAEDKRYQPLLQNVQHLGAEGGDKTYTRMNGSTGTGYSIHTGGIYGGFGGDNGTMKAYLGPFIDKMVELLRSVPGLDWRIMPGNEMARKPEKEKGETQAQADAILHDWHEFWIQRLIGLGVQRQRIVLSITGANTREAVTVPLVKKYGVVEQIHGPNSDESLLEFINRYPGAEIDGDGQDKKAAGFDNGYMTLPSIAQCKKIREICKARGLTYQTFNAHTERKSPKVNDITRARWAEQRALAGK